MLKAFFRTFSSARPLVFFEITAGENIEGQLIFELNYTAAPKTCENFWRLIMGNSEILTPKGKKLTYEGSKIHRIVPGFLFQGGDIMNMNGKGGWSIYGETFEDENFTLKHDGPGVLSMANQGPNKNNSQFFVTLSACPSLDGKHTAFGKLVKGEEVMRKIERLGTANGKPRIKIIISKCGEVEK